MGLEKGAGDVAIRRGDDSPQPSPPRQVSWGWVAAAIAAVVLVWGLLPGGETTPTEPADDTGLAAPTAPATVAPTTAESDLPPWAAEPIETEIGALTWTRLSHDQDTIPQGWIEYDDETGSYYSDDGDRQWVSVDGLTWTEQERTESDQPPGLEWFYSEGDWGVGFSEEGDGDLLFEKRAGVWTQVVLPPAEDPEVIGAFIESGPQFSPWVVSLPLVSNEWVVIPSTIWCFIPWEGVIGVRNVEWVRWDSESEVLFLHDGDSDRPVATVTVDLVDDEITISDADTGETLHTITAPEPGLAQAIFRSLTINSEVVRSGVWVRPPGGDFKYHTIETEAGVPYEFVAVPDGGFAGFEFVRPNWSEPLETRVWTSEDGVEWIDRGPLPFLDDDTGTAHMDDAYQDGLHGPIRIEVFKTSGELEYWASTDAVSWYLQGTIPDLEQGEWLKANFGYVIRGDSGQLWVSAEGDYWEEVPSPTGTDWGATGDIIWFAIGPWERRYLWVGTFD